MDGTGGNGREGERKEGEGVPALLTVHFNRGGERV